MTVPAGEAPAVAVGDSEQTVFDWSRSACDPGDYPDLPARAFRDAAGRVQLVASHETSRSMIGRTLGRLRHPCRVVMRSHHDPDPAQFDDSEWISASYTTDGRRVFALVHNEYHGYAHPRRCSTPRPRGACVYTSVTLAVSNNGGRSYRHAPSPNHLVASVPYRYVPDAAPYGVFSPSNVIRNARDGHYYSFVHVEDHEAQKRGVCLMRTRSLGDPRSWRAWDGSEFSIRFIDPYREPAAPPARHVCAPVAYREVQKLSHSLTYSTYYDRFMLVGTAAKYSPRARRVVWGFYFSLSKDLIHWSDRVLIKEVELPYTFRCGDRNPVLYPSVLDPASRSRNFETTGRRAFLYYTRFRYRRCAMTPNRDLVRVPIEFKGSA